VSKTFTLHNQGSAVIEVISGCVLLGGARRMRGADRGVGAGKSTLMRMIYGNYLTRGARSGSAMDVVQAEPREIIALRRDTLGYVSQFLRVVPRVPTLDVVAEPLRASASARRGRSARAALADPAQHPRTALVAVAHHLFGRRAAAREHRARLCPSLSRRCCSTSRRRASMPPTAKRCCA
jgi:alpha-D-ribose 1-methylphosphonate 5-triphosphate synthase subunit PhnL